MGWNEKDDLSRNPVDHRPDLVNKLVLTICGTLFQMKATAHTYRC